MDGKVYPLIKGNDHTDTPIYLDEAALIKLRNFKNDQSQDITEKLSIDLPSHEFYPAVGIIYDAWSSEVEKLSSLKKENEALKEADISSLLEKMPLHIGSGAQDSHINNSIANAIKTSETLESLGKNLLEITADTHRFSTIADAFDVLHEHDSQLDKTSFLADITGTYNRDNNSIFTLDQIGNKQYGGEITIRDFMLCASRHSAQLGDWATINSQGGYYNDIDLQPKPYTISDAKKASRSLGFEQVIDEICKTHNSKLQEEIKVLRGGTIDSSDLIEAVHIVYENDKKKRARISHRQSIRCALGL